MKYLKEPILVCLILFCFLFVLQLPFNLIYGQTSSSDTVEATIKISVCGNEIVEGGEDCEGSDLGGKTCISLGYSGGTLSCDIACSFDTTNCLAPTPTPTPTSTPTSTPTPTSAPNPTSNPTSAPQQVTPPASTSAPAATTQVFTTGVTAPRLLPAIPEVLALFDIDGSGRIEITEIFQAVKTWADYWKEALNEEVLAQEEQIPTIKKCDINHDGACNLFDLSILLYYIGR